MPVVSLAEVLVTPSFTGTQAAITKHLGPAAERAGRRAGSKMGSGMAEGLAAETKGLEAEVTRMGKAVAGAQDKVTASRAKSEAAAESESNALGALRVAELKLAETRENSRAKASQIAAAEERLSSAHSKAAAATRARQAAEQNLTRTTKDLGTAQHLSSQAAGELETHMKRVSAESSNTERSFGRLGSILNRSFRGRPLSEIARGIREDSAQIDFDLHNMAQNVSQQGTKGGRAFTTAFTAVVGGLSVITPAAGAAGSALLAATGSVVTLAGSIKDLAGVSALAPAALIAVGAGAGVLKAAFSGVGEALKEFTDLAKRPINAGANPRIAAMAVEDALRGVANAERNAADVRSQSARRVEDAQRSLQDAQDAVADAARDAAEAQVRAAQRVEEAQRDLQDAQRAAVDAARDAAQAQVMAARRVEDAQRSLQDAIEGAADAQIGATRAVERAERDEVRAARDVAEAQKDLGEARDEALARVDEVGRNSFDADRDAVDSALAYKKAVEIYNAAKADPTAAPDEITQLDNNVAKAYAADVDAKQAVIDLRREHEKAKREATAGSEAVLKAEQRVADARQAEADAVQARKDAQEAAVRQQRDGARSVEDAQLAVTDAIREQGQAADDAARSGEEAARRIADAHQGVAEAIADVSRVQEDATTAREEADRRVADAQRDVTDAVAESARAQEDAARGIEDATRNLERTQLQQGDAAEQAGLKSEAALSRLTPNAQTAVGALLAIYDQLGNIRDIAQENFFAGFAAPLLALAGTVMPQLATGVGAIATAFGGGAQQLLTSLTSALGGGVLEGLLLGVADTIGILNGAIDPIVQSFITLGVVGMDYLPQLATAIRDAATQFNTFIQGAAADGSLRGWIDAGLQGFRDVASILGSVVGIFGSLADAARAGGIDTTLGSIAAGLNSVETAMQAPAFQGTMATIFAGAAAGARGLAEALGPVGEAFRTGAPALAEFLRLGGEIAGTFLGGVFTALSDPAFGAGLVSFLSGVQLGVAAIVPLLPGLTAAFGGVLAAMGPIVQVLGPSLIQVFTAFGTGIATLLTVLSPLLTAIAGSPVILGLLIGAFVATAAASALLTAAGNVQIILMTAWKVAKMAWTAATWLAAGAQQAVTAATWLFVAAQNGYLASLIQSTATAVTHRVATSLNAAATAVSTAATWLLVTAQNSAAATFVRATVASVAQNIALVASTAATAAATAATWLLNAALSANPIGLVVLAIAALVAGLVWFFTQTELGRELWAGFMSGLRDAAESVSEWFTTTFLPLLSRVFTDLPGLMSEVGVNLLTGLLDGLTGGKGAEVLDALGKIVLDAIAWVKSLFGIQSPSTVFADIGRFLLEGLVNGILGAGQLVINALGVIGGFFSSLFDVYVKPAFDRVMSVVSSVMSWVVAFLSERLAVIQSVWSSVWGYLLTFIGQIWTNIKTSVSDAVNWVKAWVESKLLELQVRWHFIWTMIRNTASDVWEGIKTSVSDAVNWVKAWVESKLLELQVRWHYIWTMIRNTVSDVWEGITSSISDGWNRAKSTLTTLIDFVKSALPEAFEKAKNGIGDAFDKIKDKVKEPIRFVVDKVINEGLRGVFNSIPGVNIPELKLPKGFRKGGYTGDGRLDEVAGPVHRKEFVFDAAATAAAGPEKLAAMAHGLKTKGLHGLAATMGEGNMGGFFEGNAANIRRHGAYYLDVASGMDGWNFGGAAKLWDGAAGVKVATGRGQLQGRVSPLERGGGILGYTTGNNIDMSPSWMAQLAPKQRLTVAAHEVGHALGLPHNSLSSIMQPNLANMAATPTSVDIRNLQRLFPGGSGKAGEGSAANPFEGLVDTLMGEFKKAFPGGGMFIDAAGGLAKTGIGQIVQWVSDIKEGIKNIAGNVVNSIKGFFGGGAATAEPELFRDEGGWVPPGVHRVRNDTSQNEALLNPEQWRDIKQVALAGGGRGPVHNWNISAEPGLAHEYAQNIARQGEQRSRDMAAAYGTNRR